MQEKAAEIIALKALNWVIGNDELRDLFMGSTGLGIESLRAGVGEAQSEMLIAVLDFITMDDKWVVEFASLEGLQNTDLLEARQSLPGGAQVHWT